MSAPNASEPGEVSDLTAHYSARELLWAELEDAKSDLAAWSYAIAKNALASIPPSADAREKWQAADARVEAARDALFSPNAVTS